MDWEIRDLMRLRAPIAEDIFLHSSLMWLDHERITRITRTKLINRFYCPRSLIWECILKRHPGVLLVRFDSDGGGSSGGTYVEPQEISWYALVDILPSFRPSISMSLSFKIPGPGVICGLSLLLVLTLAARVFLWVLWFSSLLKNQHF